MAANTTCFDITAEQLAAYESFADPVWVFDLERRAVRRGNAAAVRMWRADDLASMVARDYSDMSEAAVRRVGRDTWRRG